MNQYAIFCRRAALVCAAAMAICFAASVSGCSTVNDWYRVDK